MEKVDDPSMTWTSRGATWSKRKRSCRQLSRNPRELSSRRRTRSSVLLLSSAKCAKRLTGVWLRKRKSLPALGEINPFSFLS